MGSRARGRVDLAPGKYPRDKPMALATGPLVALIIAAGALSIAIILLAFVALGRGASPHEVQDAFLRLADNGERPAGWAAAVLSSGGLWAVIRKISQLGGLERQAGVTSERLDGIDTRMDGVDERLANIGSAVASQADSHRHLLLWLAEHPATEGHERIAETVEAGQREMYAMVRVALATAGVSVPARPPSRHRDTTGLAPAVDAREDPPPESDQNERPGGPGIARELARAQLHARHDGPEPTWTNLIRDPRDQ